MPDRAWQRKTDDELDHLNRQVDEIIAREGLVNPPRPTRLAITVPDPNYGTYPTQAECPNTYWIVFVDIQYAADTPGWLAQTVQQRQPLDAARITAKNLFEGYDCYVPIYTPVIVHWHPRGTDGKPQLFFLYRGGTACSGSSDSGSSGSGSSGSSSSAESSSSGEEQASSSSGEEGSSSGPDCIATIGSYALSDIDNYDGAKKQALIHDTSGCLSWMDIEAC